MAGVNLFDMLTSSAGQGAVSQLGKQFGLDEATTQQAVRALLPAISGGLKRNVAQPGGLQALVGVLQSGSHAKYLEQPEALTRPETVADGNAILGHLLGSKDVSRAVAAKASERAGVSPELMKQMLPVVAALAMGALSKQSKKPDVGNALAAALGGALGGQQPAQGGAAGGMIGALLGGLMGRRGQQAQQQQGQGGMLGMLGGLLDADGDGDPTDDILKMVMNRR
ncbi:DUF937 domain-containing protein [bacterium]|nr:DUF937 domain-containing protein [bacterium]